jgi:hypothetical protein
MNRLSLSLAMHPALTIYCECPVCRQPMEQEVAETTVQVALFGAKQYGMCIGCLQEVEAPFGRAYKTRWGRRYRLLKCQEKVQ